MSDITNGVEVEPTKYSGTPLPNMRLFEGPAEIRDVFINRMGVEWVSSYIDQCAWEAATRTLIPNHTFAYRQIMGRASGLATKMALRFRDPVSKGEPRWPARDPLDPPPAKRRSRPSMDAW